MDEGGRRSLLENERMLRVITNDGHTDKGRNSNNVSRNLRREREHNTKGKKGKEINPRILREHEIEFRGRNSIKGQILADFLAETPLTKNKEAKNEEVKRKEPEPENAWSLPSYSIEHIKREQNKKADALSKLASMTFSKLAKEVLVEVTQNKSIIEKGVVDIVKEEGDN
ncbi:hypothetical protein Tco_0835268 [Tanacetum coccineum]